MATNSTSALVGNPPNTQRDYYIIRGLAAEPPNYVHETKTLQIIVGLVFIILMILVPTVTRLVLRASNPAMQFGSDDWAIILAAAVAISYAIVHILVVVQGGGGHHIWEVTYEQYNSFFYWGGLASTLYYVAVSLIKISITLFLRRIVHQALLPWRIFCDVFLVSLVLYIISALLSTTIFCNPIQAGWNLELRGQLEEPAKCLNTDRIGKALSTVHLIQGTILLLSPIIMLWKVRMSRSKKIRLYSFWIVGGLAVLGALLDFLIQSLSSDPDITWSYTTILIWAALDLCCGMLTASLPVLDAFLESIWLKTKRKVFSSSNSRGDVRGESQPSHRIGRSWTDKNTQITQDTATASRADRSESQERFVQAETMEMGDMRTKDNELRASTAHSPGTFSETSSRI